MISWQSTWRKAWLRFFLAAVAAVLGVLLSATTASAATPTTAQTYVGAITITTPVVVGFDTSVWASQHQVHGPPQAQIVVATGVATKGGSALADASSAAFRAADGAAGWAPSAKHLAGAGGRWQKFAEGADPAALVQEALRSPGASFLPDKTAGRFIVETDLGRSIGTKGETWLKVVVSDGGDIITGYPVKR